jgi:hypothetical protein
MSASRIFNPEQPFLGRDFNRVSFQFAHTLANHSLFERNRLIELARSGLTQHGSRSVRWQTSDASVNAGWRVPLYEQVDQVTEAIANLHRSNSWVLLYSVQRDPEFRALLNQVMAEIQSFTRLQQAEITWQDAYVFLASPNSITPYHIDHEATFLFQIVGNRLAHIWDPNDRSILTDAEIERYYIGDMNAATYRVENQTKAKVYELSAGNGVHHPVRAPHWFKNGETHSIALGVHFCIRSFDQQAKIYQFNHCLRQLGLRPTTPGQAPWRDHMKVTTLSVLSKRHPKDKNELLRSGINRIKNPLGFIRGGRNQTA